MSDDELTPATPPRAGTFADLSRRMDRMELRQDNAENRLTELTASVTRIELNQSHATELSKLRFDSLDTGLNALKLQVSDFSKRFEGIMSGDIETPQLRQQRDLLANWSQWRHEVDELHDAREVERAKNEGVVIALRGLKGALIAVAVVAGPVIAVVGLVLNMLRP